MGGLPVHRRHPLAYHAAPSWVVRPAAGAVPTRRILLARSQRLARPSQQPAKTNQPTSVG
jgi:hypothetical protein